MACLAIVATEVFFVSSRIYESQLERIQQTAAYSSQVQLAALGQSPSAVYNSNRSFSGSDNMLSRPSISPQSNQLFAFKTAGDLEGQRERMRRSRVITQKAPVTIEEKNFWSRFKQKWITITSAMLIWICRILAFIWVYCYHDWQSVVLLTWICHSTVYSKTSLFKKWMLFVYVPLVTAIFLWYYVINIFGLIRWTQDEAQRI